MKATDVKFFQFLRNAPHFVIPIYQRPYSWTRIECTQLWNDLMFAGSDDDTPAHFFGSIVFIMDDPYGTTYKFSLQLIDGQQRVTSVFLILESLARHMESEGISIGDLSHTDIRNDFLLNPLEKLDRRYKLCLTKADKKTLYSLLEDSPLPENRSENIIQNFTYYQDKIKRLKYNQIGDLIAGLFKLMIVEVTLERGRDNPQLIFESLNSTGRDLSQGDLIRNYILLDLHSDRQEVLYNSYWYPMEELFGQEGYRLHFDRFMRHYLTRMTTEIPKINSVYEVFKKYSNSPKFSNDKNISTDQLMKEIYSYATYYCAMALGKETDKKLSEVFYNIRELKVDVAYPLLLELYDDYQMNILSKDDFIESVCLIESYVFRRLVCDLKTNSLNKTFSTFGRAIQKNGEAYLNSIKAHFWEMKSYRRFPRDQEFTREIKSRDLYNFSRRSYWLRRIENFNGKESVDINEYTVEHILPQNPNLSEEWQEMLGSDWKLIQEVYLHTLGNLTLTGYNSPYSDHIFTTKKNMKGGFHDSPLRLNETLRCFDIWNGETIRERANQLSIIASNVWPQPFSKDSLLNSYDQTINSVIDPSHEHKNLSGDTQVRSLFDEFRTEVLAFDPCVVEEVFKTYIAYKAETNFVDLVPQSDTLLLTLNLHFHEISDPRELGKDVTDIGHQGNGDVQVKINNISDLPYVLGLVRQAFEKQIGSESDYNDRNLFYED